ncbi:MAG TPA: SH3 domain-containing protein [Azospirillaceae bacterium]|nr:SH3 domain-containing protein [Azospirillaceae bacterium]
MTAAAVLAAAFGATIATAPTASAVGSSACNSGWYGLPGHITGSAINLRSGPGTGYASKGLLSKGTKIHFYCARWGNQSWDYLKVTSGPHKGIKGWVKSRYVKW